MNEAPLLTTMTDREIEGWFAETGLAVSVVTRCPDPHCEFCAPPGLDKAA
jgi:hypothetical protein